ncbi:hypothetical protein C8J56DRAFT_936788 [Mycena floridula]|nr:hypothetical protein C8J56DRAFT_936788 [Mycena floridula]
MNLSRESTWSHCWPSEFNPRRWTAKHGPNPAGDEELHHYIGELLYKDSARLLADMFLQWIYLQNSNIPAARTFIT